MPPTPPISTPDPLPPGGSAQAAESRRQIVAALQRQVQSIETSRQPADDALSSGLAAFDRWLPQGGFRRGTLVEWLGVGPGSGACTLALSVARTACDALGTLVVIDQGPKFYPPAAAALGVDLARLVWVCPQNDRDESWALDQALRCPGVTAVLAWPERLSGRTFRRLQLAAESGGALGLLVRGDEALAQPSWAELRLLIRPRPSAQGRPRPSAEGRRLQVEIVRSRCGKQGGRFELAIHEETGLLYEPNALPLAAELADRPPASRSARA